MTWTTGDSWVLAVGAMSACACALLGNYLVLRKLSLMGDAISHAVLPGIVIAFLLTQSRGVGAMFIGAVVVGIMTAVLTQAVTRYGKVEEGAAMGVVFTILFAAGLILIRRNADDVDLDPGCVLYGNIELIYAAAGVPQQAINLAVVLMLDLLFVGLFYKELKVSSFDPALATTLGINAGWMHYGLMIMVALTAVASFEAVGSILVIAMLIVPPVAAHLLTDRMSSMMWLSLAFALLTALLARLYAVFGSAWFGAAAQGDTSALMAVFAGIILLAVIVFAPERGLVGRALQRARLAIRIRQEDMLGLLFRRQEQPAQAGFRRNDLLQSVGGGMLAGFALRSLTRRQWVTIAASADADKHVALTHQGHQKAARLVRTHRLWESYLSEHFDIPIDHLHMPAERVEHYIDADLEQRIEADLPAVATDPHGRIIPNPGDSDANA